MKIVMTHVESVKPRVVGPVPGPKSIELLRWQQHYESTAVTYPNGLPIAIARAYGPFVQDVDGNIFIDFLSGAGALSLGASHPELVAAASQQLTQVTHALDFPTPTKRDFAERILSLLPTPMREQMRIHFCGPTGADAVEAAIKIAKSHTRRDSVVSFQGGYHGCTTGAMSVTALRAPKERVRNMMPEVHFFPFSYCYRCPLGLQRSSCHTNCIGYLENTLRDTHGGFTLPAGVIVEPVQGEGGVIPATMDFFTRLRELTHALKIPLIVDEVQTGLGRTGKWFAFEHYGIEPDIILCSKALGGIGLPVAIVLYRREYEWKRAAHIGTFRGNQAAFAAGARGIRLMVEERILERVASQSGPLLSKLRQQLQDLPCVGDIRGVGYLIGIELIEPSTGRPDEALARQVQNACLQEGLIVELGGRDDSVIRLLPPLNTSDFVLETAFAILARVMTQCSPKRAA